MTETKAWVTCIVLEVISEHEDLPDKSLIDIANEVTFGHSSVRWSTLEHIKLSEERLESKCKEHGVDPKPFMIEKEDEDEREDDVPTVHGSGLPRTPDDDSEHNKGGD